MKPIYLIVFLLGFVNLGFAQPGLGFTYTHQEFEEEEDYFVNEYTIQYVFKRSPAEKAGLKVGDRVIKFNNITTSIQNELAFATTLKNSPNTVDLVISRSGVNQTFTITKTDRSNYLNICLEGNCNNGKGTFVDDQAVTYTGSFKNGQKEGKGKSINVDGDTYEGDWKNGKKEGKGKYWSKLKPYLQLSTGWSYEGDWKEDTMSGNGKIKYNNGDLYEGGLLNNNRHGQGKTTQADGTIYEGQYKDGKLNGKGSLQKTNGDSFSGNFVNGKWDGEVTVYTKASNQTSKVTYKNGVLLTSP